MSIARLSVTACVASLGVLSVSSAPAVLADSETHAQLATTMAKPNDFNGDGYPDLAVGLPTTTVAGQTFAGAVSVIYGAERGLEPTKRQLIHEGASWVPGVPGRGEEFGRAVRSGNFNGDAYADLAVSTFWELKPDGDGSPGLLLLFGGPDGLKSATRVVPGDQLTIGPNVGKDLDAADLNRDGYADLVASNPTPKTQVSPHEGPGIVLGHLGVRKVGGAVLDRYLQSADPKHGHSGIALGDVNGDRYPDLVLSQNSATGYRVAVHLGGHLGVTSKPSQVVSGGAGRPSIAIGDIDRDGYADVAVGNRDGGKTSAGVAIVWYGSKSGLDTVRGRTAISQTLTKTGASEADDQFGASLSIKDINADGFADLAIGAPGEDLGSVRDAGMVTVIYGSSKGLNLATSKGLTENNDATPGKAWEHDRFGHQVMLRDFNRDGRADLLVSAPGIADGSLTLYKGYTTGISGAYIGQWWPKHLGVPSFNAEQGLSLDQ